MKLSKEELMQMNEMSSELKEALEKRPMPQFRGPHKELREDRATHLRGLRHLMPIPGPIPEVLEEERYVTARDGYQIKIVIYRPASPRNGPGPMTMLFHEGGWCWGDLDDEEFNARLLTKELDFTSINVQYRLAPEDPFPTGILDCWAVLQWATENPTSLGADPRKGLIVGGSSAGGNIAAVLAQHARNERLDPPVTGQWLSVPYLIPSTQVPEKYKEQYLSMKENHDDPVLRGVDDASKDSRILQMVKADFESPLMSPIAHVLYPPKKDESKPPLASAYFQVAGMDPLRDHGLVYNRILGEEFGVKTRVDLYPGFGHMFWTNWPEMEMSRKFARDMVNGFRWMLQNPPQLNWQAENEGRS